MPNITIYVPDGLAQSMKDLGEGEAAPKWSRIAQDAFRREIEARASAEYFPLQSELEKHEFSRTDFTIMDRALRLYMTAGNILRESSLSPTLSAVNNLRLKFYYAHTAWVEYEEGEGT